MSNFSLNPPHSALSRIATRLKRDEMIAPVLSERATHHRPKSLVDKQGSAHWLPEEMLVKIIDCLERSDRARTRLVSTVWNRAARHVHAKVSVQCEEQLQSVFTKFRRIEKLNCGLKCLAEHYTKLQGLLQLRCLKLLVDQTSSDLQNLEMLTQLKRLHIGICLESCSLSFLIHIPQLQELCLTPTIRCEPDIGAICHLTHLTKLNFSGFTISHSLSLLSTLVHLRALKLNSLLNIEALRDAKFPDVRFSFLKQLTNLTSLSLTRYYFSREDLANSVASLTNLQKLNLVQTPVVRLEHRLQNLTRLTSLGFFVDFTNPQADFSFLAKISALRHLKLSCPDGKLREIVREIGNTALFEKLTIDTSDVFPDQLRSLTRLVALKTLRIKEAQIIGIDAIAQLKISTQLRTLEFSRVVLTSHDLFQLGELTQLTRLRLSD